ncbi:hypothetical protein [Sphingobium sp. WCS2017Hpa-17]|uniref:hypothetical protein n=1 Tax=Sphingobium sp. WCS2017Hpa-17 TaxID=3073638 RepID=UPI00288ACF89|nr:hypothetical protein [Sphingobium sp. WCS2017Hpa-17]
MTVKMNVVGGAMKDGDSLMPYVADKGDPGTPGTPGSASTVPGPEGNDGWTPVLAGELDGVRTLIKVVDWTGGEGTKPATGMYLGTDGYVATKAAAFNFNAAKRFGIFNAITNAQGIAVVSFGTMFDAASAAPSIGFWAIPATAVGGVKATQVAATLAKTGVQIKVEAPNILTAVLTVLVGATVTVIAIEQ